MKLKLLAVLSGLLQSHNNHSALPCKRETYALDSCLASHCPFQACEATFHFRHHDDIEYPDNHFLHDDSAENATKRTSSEDVTSAARRMNCADALAEAYRHSYRACCQKCTRQEKAVGACLRRVADWAFAKCHYDMDVLDHTSLCFSNHGCPPGKHYNNKNSTSRTA
jgi:hypothetical protein